MNKIMRSQTFPIHCTLSDGLVRLSYFGTVLPTYSETATLQTYILVNNYLIVHLVKLRPTSRSGAGASDRRREHLRTPLRVTDLRSVCDHILCNRFTVQTAYVSAPYALSADRSYDRNKCLRECMVGDGSSLRLCCEFYFLLPATRPPRTRSRFNIHSGAQRWPPTSALHYTSTGVGGYAMLLYSFGLLPPCFVVSTAMRREQRSRTRRRRCATFGLTRDGATAGREAAEGKRPTQYSPTRHRSFRG